MTTVTAWASAFKEIYGKTPTKSDYSLAPENVKNEFYATAKKSPIKKSQNAKRAIGISIKRRAPDEWSPVKKPAKRPAITVDDSNDYNDKPSTSVEPPARTPHRSPLKRMIPNHAPPARTPHRSPLKRMIPNHASPFRSLFDTPEKGTSSPLSTVTRDAYNLRTPPRSPGLSLKSPRKPLQKEIRIKNADVLLLPTPEKKPKIEITELFPAEEVESKKSLKIREGGEAKVFDPVQGKVIKRAFKKPSTTRSSSSKKSDTNFVRINMRKKSFVRGKVSAEQKRKMLRKMKWKKKFGPK